MLQWLFCLFGYHRRSLLLRQVGRWQWRHCYDCRRTFKVCTDYPSQRDVTDESKFDWRD
jgi:hypothetical protein